MTPSCEIVTQWFLRVTKQLPTIKNILPFTTKPSTLTSFNPSKIAIMPDPSVPQSYEIRPDPQALTGNKEDPSQNASTGVDYEPHPEKSIKLEPEREKIVQSICALYSGGASEELMQVYAEKAIYDDPWYARETLSRSCSNERSSTNERTGHTATHATRSLANGTASPK
jgi:F0F1-type ATP synthase gamma subunit